MVQPVHVHQHTRAARAHKSVNMVSANMVSVALMHPLDTRWGRARIVPALAVAGAVAPGPGPAGRLVGRPVGMSVHAREPPVFGHVNMHPWKHVPLDFENREIMSTL